MKEIVIKICGIDCAACVDRLNRTLGETEGVLEAAVNYAAGSAYLRYDEEKLGIVVNMFLTGFDATTLNTLWVDKNLKMHGMPRIPVRRFEQFLRQRAKPGNRFAPIHLMVTSKILRIKIIGSLTRKQQRL